MKLYKIEASNYETFFGTPDERIERDVITIAQTPSCDAFLYLSNETVDDDVVDRVIIDLRKKAYPSWQDQLDDIYHNGIDGWKATIKTTKDKYPKT
jgi:hypothetical protein